MSLFTTMAEDNNAQPLGGEVVQDFDSKLALLMNLRKTTRGKFTRIRNRIMNVLESDPNRREIEELVEDLKETEQKLESICCDIQTCLTSLQDQARLDQLDEWLAKLTEDSFEVRAEAAKYLEESSSRSSENLEMQRIQHSNRTFNGRMFLEWNLE